MSPGDSSLLVIKFRSEKNFVSIILCWLFLGISTMLFLGQRMNWHYNSRMLSRAALKIYFDRLNFGSFSKSCHYNWGTKVFLRKTFFKGFHSRRLACGCLASIKIMIKLWVTAVVIGTSFYNETLVMSYVFYKKWPFICP